jgi:hypothetical protein
MSIVHQLPHHSIKDKLTLFVVDNLQFLQHETWFEGCLVESLVDGLCWNVEARYTVANFAS